jgi:predicted PhzF superfamily epimerase YddE/YHI9
MKTQSAFATQQQKCTNPPLPLKPLSCSQIVVGGVATEGVHAYVRAAEGDSVNIRARMMFGGSEDAATGSANCALMGLLGCQQTEAGQLELTIAQGVEVSAEIAFFDSGQ